MTNIYVGNLSFDVTEAQLQEAFAAFGTVDKANVVVDRMTGRSRGFGFVEMGNDDEGKAAIEALNGSDLGGRALTVNLAKPKVDRGGGGGGGGGRDRRW
jgi:RNA recognition motif-containing protein